MPNKPLFLNLNITDRSEILDQVNKFELYESSLSNEVLNFELLTRVFSAIENLSNYSGVFILLNCLDSLYLQNLEASPLKARILEFLTLMNQLSDVSSPQQHDKIADKAEEILYASHVFQNEPPKGLGALEIDNIFNDGECPNIESLLENAELSLQPIQRKLGVSYGNIGRLLIFMQRSQEQRDEALKSVRYNFECLGIDRKTFIETIKELIQEN